MAAITHIIAVYTVLVVNILFRLCIVILKILFRLAFKKLKILKRRTSFAYCFSEINENKYNIFAEIDLYCVQKSQILLIEQCVLSKNME